MFQQLGNFPKIWNISIFLNIQEQMETFNFIGNFTDFGKFQNKTRTFPKFWIFHLGGKFPYIWNISKLCKLSKKFRTKSQILENFRCFGNFPKFWIFQNLEIFKKHWNFPMFGIFQKSEKSKIEKFSKIWHCRIECRAEKQPSPDMI